MAMQLQKGRRRAPMADINITPMVDVMLVLLIIFMVTAPLLVAGVPVDLPDSKASALKSDDKPIQLSLDAEGRIFIDALEIPAEELPAKLSALRDVRDDEARVYVRADQSLDYGAVMRTVGEVSAAGFRRVALVSDGEKAGPNRQQR
jgi:biopolymer transport protein TolR